MTTTPVPKIEEWGTLGILKIVHNGVFVLICKVTS